MPVAHRLFRLALLAMLIGLGVSALGSEARVTATEYLVERTSAITAAIWRPLLHGDGWLAPLLPVAPVERGPSPAVTPAGATPAPTVRPAASPKK